jgi:hypothetical protein
MTVLYLAGKDHAPYVLFSSIATEILGKSIAGPNSGQGWGYEQSRSRNQKYTICVPTAAKSEHFGDALRTKSSHFQPPRPTTRLCVLGFETKSLVGAPVHPLGFIWERQCYIFRTA